MGIMLPPLPAGYTLVNPQQPAQSKQQTTSAAPTKTAAVPVYDSGPLAGKPIPGMVTLGNIDVNHRPSISNADGTHSSIFSMTIPIGKDGHSLPWGDPGVVAYALVPSIANGKFLTPDGKIPPNAEHPQTRAEKRALAQLENAATDYYNNTKQHLGVFKTADDADNYAGATHAYMNDGTSRTVFAPSTEDAPGSDSKPSGTVQPEPDWDANDYKDHGLPVPDRLSTPTNDSEDEQ